MTEKDILKFNYKNGGHNYILLGNRKWIAFTKNVIENTLLPKYGNNFNLVVYWYKTSYGEDVDFISVPYSVVSRLLTDEHITGRGTPKARWNFIIKDGLFCVHANTNFSIDISPYLNCMNLDSGSSSPKPWKGAKEGEKKYRLHKSFERDSSLVNNLKANRKQLDPMLRCEICGFSFIEKYGTIGDGFIEAHHKKPLSTLEESTITYEDDLILVCSNCHRMLHRSNPVLTSDELISKLMG